MNKNTGPTGSLQQTEEYKNANNSYFSAVLFPSTCVNKYLCLSACQIKILGFDQELDFKKHTFSSKSSQMLLLLRVSLLPFCFQPLIDPFSILYPAGGRSSLSRDLPPSAISSTSSREILRQSQVSHRA